MSDLVVDPPKHRLHRPQLTAPLVANDKSRPAPLRPKQPKLERQWYLSIISTRPGGNNIHIQVSYLLHTPTKFPSRNGMGNNFVLCFATACPPWDATARVAVLDIMFVFPQMNGPNGPKPLCTHCGISAPILVSVFV